MDCQRIKRSTNYADFWHRLRCSECRAARKADRKISHGIGWLKLEAPPREGLDLTLAAVGLSRTVGLRKRNAGWKTLKRLSLPTGIATITLSLLGCSYLWWIDQDPQITIPEHVMPVVNAFDLFSRAGKLVSTTAESNEIPNVLKSTEKTTMPVAGPALPAPAVKSDSFSISWPIPSGVPPLPVAANSGSVVAPGASSSKIDARGTDYSTNSRPALPAGAPPTPVADHSVMVYQSDDPVPLSGYEQQDYILDKYRPALALFRQGLAHDYMEPRIRSNTQILDYRSEFRSLARLLSLEATIQIRNGNYAGAADSYLDAMQLGAMMTHGGIIISRLIGNACEAIGRQPLWTLIDHLNVAQTRHVAQRLEQIVKMRTSFADTELEEKWYIQSDILQMFRQPNWRASFGRDFVSSPEQSRFLTGAAFYLKLLPYSKQRIMDNNTRWMNTEILQDRNPWRKNLPYVPEPSPEDPVNEIVFPTFTQGRFMDLSGTEVQDQLLLATIALRAYRLDHGSYPKRLENLTPHYLQQVPTDPFASDMPLCYIRLTQAHSTQPYRLYSIGPDQQDNYGQPIINKVNGGGYEKPVAKQNSGSNGQFYTIHPNSFGDIVAGVNIRGDASN